MEDLKKEDVKKIEKKRVKLQVNEYTVKKDCLISQSLKVLKKGDKISLTKKQAEAYLKNNII